MQNKVRINFVSELKVLSKLAWPLLIAQITQTLMGVSDTIMAGRYSSIDMAAVAIGVGISLPMLVFIQGISLALTPVISRLDGAKKVKDVANNVWQMMYLMLIFAGLALLCLLFLPSLIAAIDMSEEVSSKSLGYLTFVFLAAPGFAIYQCLRNYCEGLSLTRPTMMIMGAGLLVNIPANYVLINGLYGAPELGGVGCGVATMIVIYVMAFVTFLYTFNAKKLKHFKVYDKLLPPNKKDVYSLLKMGLPIAFTLIFEVSLFAIVAVLLAPFGALTVASHQVALNVSSLIFMLPLSIGLALAIRIGFLIGEGRSDHAKLTYIAGLLLAISTVFVTATTILLFNEEIAGLYSNEAPLIAAAASLLVFAALFQFSDAIQVVSANALRGYKDMTAMFIISFIAYWLVGFPVGILLATTDFIVPKMEAAGFWIGFIVGLSVAAVMTVTRVRWIQKHKVFE